MQILDIASTDASAPRDIIPRDAIFLLGYFDGVHLGHRALIDEAKKISASRPIVIHTFDHIPKISARRGLLTTKNEKCEILASLGAEYVIFESFDDIRDLEGEEFFAQHIAAHSPRAIICGSNFKFGKRASCTTEDLLRFANNYGISLHVVNSQSLDGDTISSTLIRSLVNSGDMRNTEKYLGRKYSFTSEIIRGHQLGRRMGTPTINQIFPAEKVLPARGVYSCTVAFERNGEKLTFGGVCNVGSRPTVNSDEDDVTVETYIIDFSDEIYGAEVKTSFVEYIRGEIKFPSIEELSKQIRIDEEKAKISLTAFADK